VNFNPLIWNDEESEKENMSPVNETEEVDAAGIKEI
jgi:hypothetical protein